MRSHMVSAFLQTDGMVKTLLVDANREDRDWLSQQLSADGHEITAVEDGAAAVSALERNVFSLTVTEWVLGDMTGLELLRIIRQSPGSCSTRVLMVSRRCDAASITRALESGVDDYVVKPCKTEELIARAGVVLKRPTAPAIGDLLRAGPLTLDRSSHKVRAGERELSLSPAEFRLMAFFMENPGRVLSRQQLLGRVWKRRNGIGERTVDVHVRRLRAALEPHGCQELLQTVRGFGYRFD